MSPESDQEFIESKLIQKAEEQGRRIAQEMGKDPLLFDVRYRLVHEVDQQYLMHAAIALNEYRKEQGWKPFE